MYFFKRVHVYMYHIYILYIYELHTVYMYTYVMYVCIYLFKFAGTVYLRKIPKIPTENKSKCTYKNVRMVTCDACVWVYVYNTVHAHKP